MKKNIISLIFLLTIITSCSNENSNSNESVLVGKWYYSKEINEINGTQTGIWDWPHPCSTNRDNIEFFSNSNFSESAYLNNCQVDADNSGNGTWSINGNNLTINIWGEIYYYQIITVNNEVLKLKDINDIQAGEPDYIVVYTKN